MTSKKLYEKYKGRIVRGNFSGEAKVCGYVNDEDDVLVIAILKGTGLNMKYNHCTIVTNKNNPLKYAITSENFVKTHLKSLPSISIKIK